MGIRRAWCSLLVVLTLATSAGSVRLCPSSTTGTSPATTTTRTITTTRTPEEGPLSYWVSFPNYIRPGVPLSVGVYVPKATGPIIVGLSLVNNQGGIIQGMQNFTLQARKAIEYVYFQVSDSISTEEDVMFMRVQCWYGMEFEGYDRVYWENRDLSVFLQTDKVVYKPGETVRFRAMAVYYDLTLAQEPMDIEIRDPRDNLFVRWEQEYVDEITGVYEDQLVLSYFPLLGDWKIYVTVGEATEEKWFSIGEFEQPAFEVKLTLPRYIVAFGDTSETVSANVLATYTSGLPVSKPGSIVVTYKTSNESLSKSFTLDGNGAAEVEFSTAELSQLLPDDLSEGTLEFKATVGESETSDVMTAVTSLHIYDVPFVLEWVPGTPYVFKPDLPLTVSVQALQPDGEHLLQNAQTWDVTFTAKLSKNKTENEAITYEVEEKQETVSFDFTSQAHFTIDPVEANVYEIEISASALDGRAETVDAYFRSFISPTKAFLKMELKTESPKVNDHVTFKVVSNAEFEFVMCQVFSKGRIETSKIDKSKEPRTSTEVTFKLTSAMVPIADIVIFVVTESGEVLNDRMAMPLTADLNLILEERNDNEVKINIYAESNSTVFLLGVDQRIRNMGTENDVTMDDGMRILDDWSFLELTAKYAAGVFRNADVGFVTNANVPGRYKSDTPEIYNDPSTVDPATANFAYGEENDYDYVSGRAGGGVPSPANKLKQMLPGTWLWKSWFMGTHKHQRFNYVSPKNTTVVVTAIAVHPVMGLYFTSAPAQLELRESVRVTANVPNSVVLGEWFCFRGNAYNFGSSSVWVKMNLQKSNTEFQSIKFENGRDNPDFVKSTIKKDKVQVKPNTMESFVFCVEPLALGVVELKLTASGDISAQRLFEYVQIKPKGIKRTKTWPVLVEVPGGQDQRFSHTFNIDLPDNVVDGSLQMYVTAGGLMDDVTERLQDPLSTPYKCAEEAGQKFLATVDVFRFMYETQQLAEDTEAKAMVNLFRGYQSLLRYQHEDGSFSSFGPSSDNSPGNLWLTSVLVKGLSTFIKYTNLETDATLQSIEWITNQQSSDGSFSDPGAVPYQVESEPVPLAAHVTIALKTVMDTSRDIMPTSLSTQVNNTLSKAVAYLEGQLSSVEGKYSTLIVAYALTVTGSNKATEAQDKMNALLETDATSIPWEDLEMKPYALMTHLHNEDLDLALPLYRSLIELRRFYSTLNSNLVSEALTNMAIAISAGDQRAEITIDRQGTQKMEVNSAYQHQTQQISIKGNDYPAELTISATNGVYALVEVTVHYYTAVFSVFSVYFGANATVSSQTSTSYVVDTCLDNQFGDVLTVVEIGIASGYQMVDTESNARSVTTSEDKVTLLYDTLDHAECSSLTMKLKEGIAVSKLEKPPVRIYNFNYPDDDFVTFYTLEEHHLCDMDEKACED